MIDLPRSTWVWAAIGGGVLLVLGGWGAMRQGALAEQQAKADSLQQQYLKLYHPDQPQGFAVQDARRELAAVQTAQAEELAVAERALAPALPDAYLRTDLADASATVQADLVAIRHLAERQKVAIPATLPFQSGLDAEARKRALQLAQLHLMRLVTESAIHAGVARISSCEPGPGGTTDPTGSYAQFPCELKIESTWDAATRLITALTTPDGRGLGIANLSVDPGADSTTRKVAITATLTVANRSEWGLGAAASTAAPTTKPAESSGSRLRRLGTRP